LTYPDRESAPVPRLDWTEARTWTFAAPDLRKFPLLALAYSAQDSGGSATCTLNAADEIAVSAFLKEEISFPGIARVVRETLERVPVSAPQSIGEVLEVDRKSREVARQVIGSMAGRPEAQYSSAG
jgi:1-deoxy-D-xylulose-5-phosphate reductoisomerase